MFERYTEKARRVVFFARYEAGKCGEKFIRPPHLLLGLLREDAGLFLRFLPGRTAIGAIRVRTLAELPPNDSEITAADIPLYQESKRVLTYASEEAERMGSRYIDTGHILLGILLEQEVTTQKILGEFGINLKNARQKIATNSEGQFEGNITKLPNAAKNSKCAELVRLIQSDCPDRAVEEAFLNFEITRWEDIVATLTALQMCRPAIVEKLIKQLRKAWQEIAHVG
jgi:ATP-dependent Clp protease ATP-binding subunit ClpC